MKGDKVYQVVMIEQRMTFNNGEWDDWRMYDQSTIGLFESRDDAEKAVLESCKAVSSKGYKIAVDDIPWEVTLAKKDSSNNPVLFAIAYEIECLYVK